MTVELELKDWKDMEQAIRESIRTGLKMQAMGQQNLKLVEQMIKNLGGETEHDRAKRVKREQSKESKDAS